MRMRVTRKRLALWTGLVAGLGAIAVGVALSRTPRYVRNWHLVTVAMAKEDVLAVLGQPTVRSGPAAVAVQGDGDSVPAVAAAGGIGAALSGDTDEYWAYVPRRLGVWKALDSVFGPSDEAFVVYFDADGKVAGCRGPLRGPYATTSSWDSRTNTGEPDAPQPSSPPSADQTATDG